MKRKIVFVTVIISILFISFTGCSKSKPEEKVKQEIVPQEQTICAANLTFNNEYLNGIHLQRKNLFFINIGKKDSSPVECGDRIKFAKSGEALIQSVDRQDTPDISKIFITVDKSLDPMGDGYPNPIIIPIQPLHATNFTSNGEYLNGIYLKRKNMFFITIAKQVATPVAIGDKLKFAKTGEVFVKTVARDETQEKSRIFITVDKPLDPAGDGFPNPITIPGKQK